MGAPAKSSISAIRYVATGVALVGAVLCALGFWLSPDRFFEAYLFAFIVVSGVGLGCMAVVMLQHLVGGKWARVTQRILEAACWPLVVTPVLAVPLLLGVEHLYPWADAGAAEHDALLASKQPYLNAVSFQQRAVLYLVAWALLAWLLSQWSRTADRRPDRRAVRQSWLRKLSAPGLVVYVLTATFASIDWMMSLEPHWFSSIYGVIVIAGQGAAAFAVAVSAMFWLRDESQLRPAATLDVLQDLGNLLLTSITFWIYVTFSQFLIIWSGNLTEEVPWYLTRSQSGWQWLALLLVLLHFVVPFVALLSRAIKRNWRYLACVAYLVLIMHIVDVYWLVMPASRGTLAIHWLDLVTLVTLGAIWKAVSAWRLNSAALLAARSDEQGITHGHVGAWEQA